MSSFVRRMQRQVMPSQRVHWGIRRDPVTGKQKATFVANPPRGKFWMGRGSKLGVKNPKCRELLARLKRDEGRAR